jgi:hypothetical protein
MGMANNGMTDAHRAALPVDSQEYHLRVVGSVIQLSGWSVYSVLLWSLKASWLVFYLRLTVRLHHAQEESNASLIHTPGGPWPQLSHSYLHWLRTRPHYMVGGPVELVPKLSTVPPLLADQPQPRK